MSRVGHLWYANREYSLGKWRLFSENSDVITGQKGVKKGGTKRAKREIKQAFQTSVWNKRLVVKITIFHKWKICKKLDFCDMLITSHNPEKRDEKNEKFRLFNDA